MPVNVRKVVVKVVVILFLVSLARAQKPESVAGDPFPSLARGYCSTGCRIIMLYNEECDLQCMTPECDYDHGDCDEQYPTQLDFRLFLFGSDMIPSGQPVLWESFVNETATSTSRIARAMQSVTKEEFELADDDGDGLELKEAFALWMMKTHICTQKNDSDSGECTNNETWVDKYGQGCDMYEAAPDACGTAVLHADEDGLHAGDNTLAL